MFRASNADPKSPVIPVPEFKTLGVKAQHPPKSLAPTAIPSAGSFPFDGRTPAFQLGAKDVYCYEPFYTFYICRNQEVKPCCNAELPTYMGNVSKTPATQLWASPEFDKIRTTILDGDYPNVCVNCVKWGGAHQHNHFMDAIANYVRWFKPTFGVNLFELPEWQEQIWPIKNAGNNGEIAARRRGPFSGR